MVAESVLYQFLMPQKGCTHKGSGDSQDAKNLSASQAVVVTCQVKELVQHSSAKLLLPLLSLNSMQ